MRGTSQSEGELVQWRTSVRVAGEDVPGLFFAPRDLEPGAPLVLLQHPAMSSKEDYFVTELARLWAPRGWVCGGIDAPLHGDRTPHDPLGSARDRRALPAAAAQLAAELPAVLRAVEERFATDPSRVAFVGFALGATLGMRAVAAGPRFRAAVLCQPAPVDGTVPGTGEWPSQTSVRVIGKVDDRVIPRSAVEAVFEAIAGEKDLVWLPGDHFELGPDVAAASLEWLKRHLQRSTTGPSV